MRNIRNINRIPRVLEKLEELWLALPDYRFWQVICALSIPEEYENTDAFFWEDDVWERIFANTLKEIKGEN